MAQSLEQRINAALRSAARLKDVEAVIADVETEIGATQSKLDAENARSIDPALTTPQAREARNNAADLEHDIRRLNASLGMLQEKRDKIVAETEEARRQAHYEAVKAERDDLARHIRSRYPEIALELLNLARRIQKSDADCEAVRLLGAEYTARETTACGWEMSKGGGALMRITDLTIPLLGRPGYYLPISHGFDGSPSAIWQKAVDLDQELSRGDVTGLDPEPQIAKSQAA